MQLAYKVCCFNPKPAKRNQSVICKQLGSGRDGVSSGSKLFDTHTQFSPTLSDIEARRKLKQMTNLTDDKVNKVNPTNINIFHN